MKRVAEATEVDREGVRTEGRRVMRRWEIGDTQEEADSRTSRISPHPLSRLSSSAVHAE